MTRIGQTFRCPVCKRAVSSRAHSSEDKSSSFPFCSEPCREADLGNWMAGQYAIPAAPDDLDDMSFDDAAIPIVDEAAENEE